MLFPDHNDEQFRAMVAPFRGVAARDTCTTAYLSAKHQKKPKMPTTYQPHTIQICYHVGWND